MDDFISKPIGREQLLEVVAGAGEAPPEGADGDVEEGTRATTEPEADAMPLGNGRARREAPPDPAERAGDGESSVLDEAALDSLRSLDPEGRLPDRLVDLFLSESAGRVEQLREAARDRDADRVRRLAHGFKGSAGYFGAARLLAVCRDLEKHATDASPAELEASAEEVASCFAEAKAAIDAVRERERTR